MPERNENSRRRGARALTWACLAAVPVVAVAVAGPALSSALRGDATAAPSGLLATEARAFGAEADGLATKPAEPTGFWQNTTRVPYIPGPRSPYIPPGP